MQYAKKSSLAGRSGAVIDGDTVYVPSTLTLSKASSHIPLTVDGTNDRLAFTLGGKSYDLRLENRAYGSLSDLAAEINAKMAAANGGSTAGDEWSAGTRLFSPARRRTQAEALLSLQHLPAEQAENNPRRYKFALL